MDKNNIIKRCQNDYNGLLLFATQPIINYIFAKWETFILIIFL